MKLSEIDPNFQLAGTVPENTVFRDVWDSPFKIYGLAPNEKGLFCRLPAGLLPRCSESVRRLAECTAGACVRFSTDAEALTVLWELKEAPICLTLLRPARTGWSCSRRPMTVPARSPR